MAFEKGKPEPGIKAKFLDDRVRDNNDFIQPALDNDHDFTDSVGANQTGKHKTLHMLEQSSPGASATGEGNFAVVDSGTQPELEFTSEDGAAKQLTADGFLNNTFADMSQVAIDEDDMSSDSNEKFPTQQSVKAYQDDNTTDDAETDLSAKSWFLNEDGMSSDDDTKVASQQSIKAYTIAKAGPWVKFLGRTTNGACTINANYGITSVTRTGTGLYTVLFSSAWADNDYVWSGNSLKDGSSSFVEGQNTKTEDTVQTTTQLFIATTAAGGGQVDVDAVWLTTNGNLA